MNTSVLKQLVREQLTRLNESEKVAKKIKQSGFDIRYTPSPKSEAEYFYFEDPGIRIRLAAHAPKASRSLSDGYVELDYYKGRPKVHFDYYIHDDFDTTNELIELSCDRYDLKPKHFQDAEWDIDKYNTETILWNKDGAAEIVAALVIEEYELVKKSGRYIPHKKR